MSTSAIVDAAAQALSSGRPHDAARLLDEAKAALVEDAVLIAAEAYAATGAARRGAALLTLASRASPTSLPLAKAAARAVLNRGLHRRAQRVLDAHQANAPVLWAIARKQPAPVIATPAVDVDDDIDRALAVPSTTTAQLQALLERAPRSARVRIALAERVRASGDLDGGRAVLRADLKTHADARVELALALAAFADGNFDEASMVTARARARHPRWERSRGLRLLLATAALANNRTNDAVSVLNGAKRMDDVEGILLSLLRGVAPTAPPPPPSPAAPAPAPPPTAPPKPAPPKPTAPKMESTWRAPIVEDVVEPDGMSKKVWFVLIAVLLGAVGGVMLLRVDWESLLQTLNAP